MDQTFLALCLKRSSRKRCSVLKGAEPWKDVNFAESTLYVRRAFIEVARKGIIEIEAKTAKGRRSIRLPPLAIEDLKDDRTKQLLEVAGGNLARK